MTGQQTQSQVSASENAPVDKVHHAHLKYRAYIDGLRAIAVLVVLFFHAHLGLSGGYVGVDIFFVISGYLITGLILKDLDKDQFHIVEFWERRVRRIMPALSVVVFSTIVVGWFLFFPVNFRELGETVSAQAVLGANIYFWQNSGYFARTLQENPLLHTWSLAVEEQFYLFFPFLLIVLRRLSKKSLIPAIIILGVLSFGLSVYFSYSHPLPNFYLLPTRAWELLIGAFLAALPVKRASVAWLTEVLCWGGLMAIFYAVFFYDKYTRFPGLAALLPCAGAGLVIWSNGHTLTSGGKILATRPVVFVGLISYSLYLWHWPVLVFARYCTVDAFQWWRQPPVLLGASFILAILSWKFVETPFRTRTVFKRRSQIFSFAAITTTVLLVAGLSVFKLQGVPSRFPAAILDYADGSKGRAFRNDMTVQDVLGRQFVELGNGDKQKPADLFVWGDSHAMAVMSIVDQLCKEHSVRGLAATHSGSPPLLGYESLWGPSKEFNQAVLEYIRSQHFHDLILVTYWDYYLDLDRGKTDRLRRGLLDTLTALQGTGARIWVIRQIPHQHWDVPRAVAYTVFHGQDPQRIGLPLAEQKEITRLQDPIFEGITAKFSDVTILDPTYCFVNSNNLCRVEDHGKALYFDDDHLSIEGAKLLRPMFEPVFEGTGKSADRSETNERTLNGSVAAVDPSR